MDIIAQNITKNENQVSKESLIKLTIQIGQLIEFNASSLSFGFFGLNIFSNT
jgi:hypothetical protein